jgi:hypothetical protein
LPYSPYTPVDINLSLSRQLFEKNPKKTLGLRSYSGMGRSKKPSHATVPLMMTTHEKTNIIRSPDIGVTYFKSYLTFPQCKDAIPNLKQIFPGKELRGYSPNSYIHVSVSDLYIPLIGLFILLQEIRWAERGNICRSLTDT